MRCTCSVSSAIEVSGPTASGADRMIVPSPDGNAPNAQSTARRISSVPTAPATATTVLPAR
jgi:hypothetical protein